MNLSPLPIQKFFDNNGIPLVGGQLFTYVSGTSTKIATYKDSSGTLNTNPVVMDFRGECRLWIDPTLAYTFVLAPATDTDPPGAPIWTVNDITAGPANQDNSADDTGPVNNVQLSIPQISSPVAFTRIVFKANHTNTGPVTISINGGTAYGLTWQSGVELQSACIVADGIYQAIFDGTRWQLQGPTLNRYDVRLYGAVGDGVADDTSAIQATINLAGANSEVYFPTGTYLVTSRIDIGYDRVHLNGDGQYATTIQFQPTSSTSCFRFINGSTTINQGSIRKMALRSTDSTYTKTALDFVDMSGYVIEDVVIGGTASLSPSTGGWGGGSGSVGIHTRGRDLNSFINTYIAADRCLVISPNPNGSPQISLDHTNFHNLTMLGGAFPLITIETGCVLTQISFTGHQVGVLGKGWLDWQDATSPGSSNGIYVYDVRYENTLDVTAYFVRINLVSDLQMILFQGGQTGGGRGFHLRSINNLHLDSFFYSDSSREAMNADTSVDEIVFTNCSWQTGSTATLTGLSIMNRLPGTVSGPLPKNGYIKATPTGSDQEIIESTIGGNSFSLANDGLAIIGTTTQLGYIVIDAETEQVTALYELRGTNHATSEVNDPSGFFTVTPGNATTYNIYWDAGSSAYVIQNKTGGARTLRVMRFGRA